MSHNFIIAIDGPAASGKGTLARKLGEHFGYPVLDTGLLYRAVAYSVLNSGLELTDSAAAIEAAKTLKLEEMPKAVLRTADMGEAASVVAAIPQVREALLDYQRMFSTYMPGAILDGRDIGTFVVPHAHVKLFITASAHARAARRTLELQNRGEEVNEADILADILKRDERDANRSLAPLLKADDAIELDTTGLSIEQVFERALVIIELYQKKI